MHLVLPLSMKTQLAGAGTASHTSDLDPGSSLVDMVLLVVSPNLITFVGESGILGLKAGLTLYFLCKLNIFNSQNINVFIFHLSSSCRGCEDK